MLCSVGQGDKLESWDFAFDVVLLDALICLNGGEIKMIIPLIYYW